MDKFCYNITIEDLCNVQASGSIPVIRSDNGKGVGELHSYRGFYEQLAFNPVKEICTFDSLISEARSAIGKIFIGWKGGEFLMTKSTPLWIASDGHVSHNAIVGVKVKDDKLTLVVKKVYG